MTEKEFDALSYSDQTKYAFSCLDTIDFIPLIESCETVGEIYGNLPNYQDWTGTIFDNDIFYKDPGNVLAICELGDYLNERYKDEYYFREPEYWDPPIYIYKRSK